MKRLRIHKRLGFSLMELLAVVTILGIIAAIIVPRVTVSSDAAKAKVNLHNKGTINASVERWYMEKGSWPANNLSESRRSELFPGRDPSKSGGLIGVHSERDDPPSQLDVECQIRLPWHRST